MSISAGETPEERESSVRALLPIFKRKNGVALAGIIIGWIGFVPWLVFWALVAWGFFTAATAPTPS